MGWRRFLGFLAITEATALEIAPAKRLTIERVRRFADHLAETNSPHSVASQMDALYGAARAMIPGQEWTWLRNVKARLYSQYEGQSRDQLPLRHVDRKAR
jgi:hypothetical protein